MESSTKKFPKDQVKKKLQDFFKPRTEVLLAYIFGSVAENKQNRLSDLDVAVLVEHRKLQRLNRESFGFQISVLTELMASFHTNDVDLVILNEATPLLAYEVVKFGEVVHCRDLDARIQFELHVKHRYLDTKPLRDIQDYYFKERVRRGLVAKVG